MFSPIHSNVEFISLPFFLYHPHFLSFFFYYISDLVVLFASVTKMKNSNICLVYPNSFPHYEPLLQKQRSDFLVILHNLRNEFPVVQIYSTQSVCAGPVMHYQQYKLLHRCGHSVYKHILDSIRMTPISYTLFKTISFPRSSILFLIFIPFMGLCCYTPFSPPDITSSISFSIHWCCCRVFSSLTYSDVVLHFVRTINSLSLFFSF